MKTKTPFSKTCVCDASGVCVCTRVCGRVALWFRLLNKHFLDTHSGQSSGDTKMTQSQFLAARRQLPDRYFYFVSDLVIRMLLRSAVYPPCA